MNLRDLFAQDTGGATAKLTSYSVWMYDTAGRVVWSAQNQGDRNYNVNSNVKRIEMRRTCGCKSINFMQRR